MARPKLYNSPAQKQAAYRARRQESMAVVDRQALECLHRRLEALQQAVSAAARRGDPLAQCCCAGSVDTMLEKVTAAFQKRAEKGT